MNNTMNTDRQSNEPARQPTTTLTRTEPVIIPVIEEQVQVGKKLIETGVVRIAKRVIEEPQTVDIPVFREEVTVEHIAVYQYVDEAPAVRYEGETMIIPVLREVLVTEKRLLLIEEVHVTKRHITDQETQEVMLRKEEITVERSEPNDERSA
ncbi:YsnF/AvaK domain-containing protein [Spirosoma areae]